MRTASESRACRPNRSCGRWAARPGVRAKATRSALLARNVLRVPASAGAFPAGRMRRDAAVCRGAIVPEHVPPGAAYRAHVELRAHLHRTRAATVPPPAVRDVLACRRYGATAHR